MNELSLNDLQVFARVAALGSLSATARERSVSVSQISRTVDRVQRVCGVALMRRSARGINLTGEGADFLRFCQDVGERREDLLANFASGKLQAAGRIRVSLSSAIAKHWVVPSLMEFRSEFANLGVDLVIDDGIVDLVREGIDLAIRTGPPMALSVVARPLGFIETGLFASAGYLSKRDAPRSPEDLKSHLLLSNIEHPNLNQWTFKSGVTLVADGPVRSTNTDVIAALAADGLGIAHLPVQVTRVGNLGGELTPVLSDDFLSAAIPVNAVFPVDGKQSPRLLACLSYLGKIFE